MGVPAAHTGSADELRRRELDALLVETPINLRYLTGFTGSHALVLLDAAQEAGSKLGGNRFLTDFRYATQSSEEVPDAFERTIVAGELLDAAARSLPVTEGRLGFDEACKLL